MPVLQNIIFDFGNVLFDLDLGATGREIQKRVGASFEAVYKRLRQDRIFELYETGGLTTGEFVDAICRAGSGTLDAEQVIAAWNAILLGMPPERFELLRRLRRQYRVFLLSNINELHAGWIDAYMLREYGLSDFQLRYFDGVYYSHLIRLRKPDREIYEYVLADAELWPEECLFIDDLEENVQAAEELGIQGIVKRPDRDILDILHPYLSP